MSVTFQEFKSQQLKDWGINFCYSFWPQKFIVISDLIFTRESHPCEWSNFGKFFFQCRANAWAAIAYNLKKILRFKRSIPIAAVIALPAEALHFFVSLFSNLQTENYLTEKGKSEIDSTYQQSYSQWAEPRNKNQNSTDSYPQKQHLSSCATATIVACSVYNFTLNSSQVLHTEWFCHDLNEVLVHLKTRSRLHQIQMPGWYRSLPEYTVQINSEIRLPSFSTGGTVQFRNNGTDHLRNVHGIAENKWYRSIPKSRVHTISEIADSAFPK